MHHLLLTMCMMGVWTEVHLREFCNTRMSAEESRALLLLLL